MDLVGAYPGMSCNFDIDVTLRAAHAGRYRAAARDALQPLQLAEEEKHERRGASRSIATRSQARLLAGGEWR